MKNIISNSTNAARSIVKSTFSNAKNIVHKNKKIIQGIALWAGLYLANESPKDMRIVSTPYAEVVNDFLEKQNINDPKGYWVKTDDMEFSNWHFSKEGNMPYESTPLAKIYFDKSNNSYKIMDLGWIDDNGDIISIRQIMLRNNENLSSITTGFSPAQIWYSVGSIMNDEKRLQSYTISMTRKIPDVFMDSFRPTSRSSMRVKRVTLNDYTESECEKMLNILARFEIPVASRERQLLHVPKSIRENEWIYTPIYKIHGYDTPEEFIEDFKKNNIKTNHETWVALGIIIATYIREHIMVTDSLEIDAKNFFEKNQIDILPQSIKRTRELLNISHIDASEGRVRPYSRVWAFYPTNVNQTLHDSRVQMKINYNLLNAGKFPEMVMVDGSVWDKTLETAWENNILGIEKYNKNNPHFSDSEITSMDNSMLPWAHKMNDIRMITRENKKFSDEHSLYLANSMKMNLDNVWISYRTIRTFLVKYDHSTKIAELDTAFDEYVNHTWENREHLYKIFDEFANYERASKYFPVNASKDSLWLFYGMLTNNMILAWYYLNHTGYTPDKFAPKTFKENETNTAARATNNFYEESILKTLKTTDTLSVE